MANTINTRIVLRNDELSAWEASDKKLLKGEVAFAKLSGSNEFEMRIGDGNSTWAELSNSNVVVPDSTKFYEVTLTSQVALADKVNALSDYNATAKNGDIGVVKELIADGKYSHTAYRWDKATTGWVALDGNYSADNVIFDDDIKVMYPFGKLSAASTTNVKTLEAKGKSISEVFAAALTEVKQPTTATKPSISLNGLTASLTGEVGAKITTIPKVTLKFEDGAYTYGPEPTGSKLSSYVLSCSNSIFTTLSATYSEAADFKSSGDIVSQNAITLTTPYTLSATKLTAYTISAYGNYTAGDHAKDNIGSAATVTSADISAGTATASTVVTVQGYYPWYEAVFASKTIADPANITSADIITLNNNIPTAKSGWTKKIESDNKPNGITSWTNKTMQQWFWVAKKGVVSKIEVTQQKPEAPHTVSKTTVNLPTANGYGDTEYDVFYVSNGASDTNGFKVTIS